MNKFSVKVNDHEVKGISFHVENPKSYLLVITGMDEHSRRYEYFATKLNEKNISVDVMDFIGQGENVESVEQQEIWFKGTWQTMLDALKAKLEELKQNGKPVFLMGHSMGSILTQNFLLKYPDTASKVIIMGGVGPHPFTYPLAHVVCNMFYSKKKDKEESKLMTKLILGSANKSIKNPKTEFDWLSHDEKNVQDYINDPYCGHYNTWGFYKEFTSGLSQLYKKKNLKKLSKNENIFIVSGEDDPIGNFSKDPIKLSKLYKKYGIEKVKVKIYPHMRHEMLNEATKDDVINDILDFLAL